jgi:DNA-binding LacI/PurR family transcriptional regulator
MADVFERIAGLAGLSRQTVRLVLQGRGNYRPETRQRVWRAARESGYRPRSWAEPGGAGRFGAVVLLRSRTDRSRSYLPVDLLDGIEDELARRGLYLITAKVTDEELTSEGKMPSMLREFASDGLIINYHVAPPAELGRLVEGHRIAAVWINNKRDADCIYPDEREAARKATERLIDLGHRRIAHLDRALKRIESPHFSRTDRVRGYEEAMRAEGLEPDVVSAPAREEFMSALSSRLGDPNRTTAALCQDQSNLLACHFAAARLGLDVPRDLSLAVFSAKRDHKLPDEKRTAKCFTDWERLGVEAVAMLAMKIERPAELLPPRRFRIDWLEGESVAPPRPAETR